VATRDARSVRFDIEEDDYAVQIAASN